MFLASELILVDEIHAGFANTNITETRAQGTNLEIYAKPHIV